MDTFKTYVKMCEKAEKIQEGWNPREGDFFERSEVELQWNETEGYNARVEIRQVRCFSKDLSIPGTLIPEPVWLPRQDQLQDMINKDPFKLHAGFDSFIFDSKGSMDWAQSMEQLWLAYTMKEKFNKVWNGEEWDFTHP